MYTSIDHPININSRMNILQPNTGMGNLMQHDSQNLRKASKLPAMPRWFHPQIQLNIRRGSIGIVASVASTEADPFGRCRFNETLDAPTAGTEDGVDVTGDGGEEGAGDVGSVAVGVYLDGPNAAVLTIG